MHTQDATEYAISADLREFGLSFFPSFSSSCKDLYRSRTSCIFGEVGGDWVLDTTRLAGVISLVRLKVRSGFLGSLVVGMMPPFFALKESTSDAMPDQILSLLLQFCLFF